MKHQPAPLQTSCCSRCLLARCTLLAQVSDGQIRQIRAEAQMELDRDSHAELMQQVSSAELTDMATLALYTVAG